MSGLIAKFLTGKLLAKIGKAIVVSLLRELAKKSDNTIDDAIVAAVEDALE